MLLPARHAKSAGAWRNWISPRRPENRKKKKRKKEKNTTGPECLSVQGAVRFVNHWHWHWQHTLHLPVSKKREREKKDASVVLADQRWGIHRETQNRARACASRKKHCFDQDIVTQHSILNFRHSTRAFKLSSAGTTHYTTLHYHFEATSLLYCRWWWWCSREQQ